MFDLQQKVHMCAKLMKQVSNKGNFMKIFCTNKADDPYQLLWFLNEEVLILRQCRAIWFTWQHLNIEVPLLISLIIRDGQLLFKLNLYLYRSN